MSINALQAVQIANQTRLLNGGAEAWGSKVRVSFVKSSTAYPYVLQFWAGGGHDQSIRTRDATLRMGVKAVSDKMDDALKAAERIHDLLHNHGRLDNSAEYLSGGTDWDILTITEEDAIYLAEWVPDTIPIYHAGAYYRYIMQHK